ncbi:hypothetical protein V1520DRAFT_370872 [Lipomyces starkeyi]|uniref:Xylanolytic transcriptional activator regulatory domain-containing protein n=1 Tax=Lipomyces starkeyi NRRL Y-11557 TaxID=675824 RepID=A0A1E3QE49_LIPST|nr:hypothetical protein LIPSTDRAFT_1368 [Lipomyces starkeyi NRRL Y-11557]
MSDFSSFTGKFRARSRLRVINAGNLNFDAIEVNHAAAVSKEMMQIARTSGLRNQELATVAKPRSKCRLTHLESLVKNLMWNQESAPSDNDVISPEFFCYPVENVVQTQSEKVDTTRYVGSTHWSAILDDIHELKVVLGGYADVQEAEKPATPEKKAGSLYLDRQILTLGNWSSPDICLRKLRSIGISRCTSRRQYREFWADTASVNPLWLSMLFSICCLASLIRGATDSNHSPQTDLVAENSKFHTAAGQCLVIGEYHRSQQFAVEALAIYAQCKNLRTLDPSREAGAILGIVVHMAYQMGYHRDPDSFGYLTVFEREMRRRFWAACKQMDVMISFQLGLPSNICLENCDTKSPRNLLDSDFDVDTQVLPASRSENEATRLLWFIVKDRQMICFSKVFKDTLSFKEKSEAEILQLDEEIRQMYKTIPDILRTRPLSESIADAPFLIMTRLYVEFIYLKSLCVLHRRYMAGGNVFSTKSCIKAGKRLVSQFIDMYNEFSPGGQLHAERWMLTNFAMNDFFLGIMVLCLMVHINRKRGSQQLAIDSAREREVLPLLEQSYDICVEKSQVSRDARRVSHAVRLILNGTKTSNAGESQSGGDNAPGIDLASLSLQPEHGDGQGNETPFDLLDPFNFMGNDFENIDWTVFDPQISG